MGQLVEGKWTDDTHQRTDAQGAFLRPDSVFRDWVKDAPDARFPAEAGRYHLFVAQNCPWAHRTAIFRKLKGLEAAGLVKNVRDGVRLIGGGEIKAKLTLNITGASAGGKAAVEKAGGKVNVSILPKAEQPHVVRKGKRISKADRAAKAQA